MDIRKELLTLVQLMSLMFLFFWSATWNIPPNFDMISNPTRKPRSSASSSRQLEVLYPDGFPKDNKHSIVMESFKSVKSDAYKALRMSASTLPPFDAWKEEELTKQDTDLHGIQHPPQRRKRRRKLNYASSKCGAKILSSNPEASFRMSILNEKIDEYMLNPCRLTNTWFVIELCDTIEATQIELANYELFSSSPRMFSCYWSDVPTKNWHPLGTFEAKDERSTQTFDLKEKNLGKFIKVVISSYHGQEHFCLLSVFRVLGYSMIHEFDNDEPYENDPKKYVVYSEKQIEYNRSLRLPKKLDENSTITGAKIQKAELWNKNLAQFCLQSSLTESKRCLNEPICLFLNLKTNVKFVRLNNKNKDNEVCLDNRTGTNQTCPRIKTKENTCKSMDYFLQCVIKSSARRKIVSGTARLPKSAPIKKEKFPFANTLRLFANEEKLNFLKPKRQTGVSESAALIQKESVLSKLTLRIKASEMSLSLINRYLQQLSESYRQQMEDMQIMFNGTMEAISLASVKAAAIDEQQQSSIEKLEEKVNSLNERVEYFASGQENLFKQLVELHGFFLILEFIIVSTLFSIFVNNFRRRNSFFLQQRSILLKTL